LSGDASDSNCAVGIYSGTSWSAGSLLWVRRVLKSSAESRLDDPFRPSVFEILACLGVSQRPSAPIVTSEQSRTLTLKDYLANAVDADRVLVALDNRLLDPVYSLSNARVLDTWRIRAMCAFLEGSLLHLNMLSSLT
jgi:hypothetical protein